MVRASPKPTSANEKEMSFNLRNVIDTSSPAVLLLRVASRDVRRFFPRARRVGPIFETSGTQTPKQRIPQKIENRSIAYVVELPNKM